jgi:hypothetical protein
MNLKWQPTQISVELSCGLFGPDRAEITKRSNDVEPDVNDATHKCGHRSTDYIFATNNRWKKQAWADLFVTLRFGYLSQIAMSPALRVFTLGMFGFVETIVAITLVCLLAAIASILLPCALLLELTVLRPHRVRHIEN